MDAEVAKRAEPAVDATDGDALIEQLDGQGLVRRLLGPADRVPVLAQRRPQSAFVHDASPGYGAIDRRLPPKKTLSSREGADQGGPLSVIPGFDAPRADGQGRKAWGGP